MALPVTILAVVQVIAVMVPIMVAVMVPIMVPVMVPVVITVVVGTVTIAIIRVVPVVMIAVVVAVIPVVMVVAMAIPVAGAVGPVIVAGLMTVVIHHLVVMVAVQLRYLFTPEGEPPGHEGDLVSLGPFDPLGQLEDGGVLGPTMGHPAHLHRLLVMVHHVLHEADIGLRVPKTLRHHQLFGGQNRAGRSRGAGLNRPGLGLCVRWRKGQDQESNTSKDGQVPNQMTPHEMMHEITSRGWGRSFNPGYTTECSPGFAGEAKTRAPRPRARKVTAAHCQKAKESQMGTPISRQAVSTHPRSRWSK
jgi:hypothetical protein